MKKKFKWYFPLSANEIKAIWKEGILVVDTNVLLDLYRYHQNTQRALLDSLNGFKGRAWLPYQVADEFFRNRNVVILSANGAFNDAERMIMDVKKSIEEPLKKLKSSRIIPDELEEKLETAINIALNDAELSIKRIRSEYPEYRKNDPILASITRLFESNIGSPFNKEELVEVLKEAKRRKENKIPPGFKDSNKDGDKPYGDYIVWCQIINYIKGVKKPLIFVTSEQKEDWWEKASGQITGPLYDLLKEFYEETEQRFLFYQTDRFLEFSAENSGKKANADAVEEIRNVARQQLRDTPLVKVLTQNAHISDAEIAAGILKIELLEPAYSFTCSGHFVPELNMVPDLRVKLASFPVGIPNHVIRSGTGTTFDFNIHLRSINYGAWLPVGVYVFEYEANVKKNKNLDNLSIAE
jgi:hypothetical protein